MKLEKFRAITRYVITVGTSRHSVGTVAHTIRGRVRSRSKKGRGNQGKRAKTSTTDDALEPPNK